MPDYKNGKIYAIRSHQTDLFYIGSTTRPLSQRLGQHRFSYNNNLNKSSQHILKYPDYYIELIENYSCNGKDELETKEGQYIRQFKDKCVNVVFPKRTKKEYYEDNKQQVIEKSKAWYKSNKEHRAEYYKEYRETNKEQITEKKKEYYEANKEQIAKQRKEYCETNKEQLSEKAKQKYDCECGVRYSHHHKARHLKSMKHQKYLAN